MVHSPTLAAALRDLLSAAAFLRAVFLGSIDPESEGFCDVDFKGANPKNNGFQRRILNTLAV